MPVLQVNYILPMIPQGNTALIYACQKEDISSVQFLNNLGANPNACNKVIYSTWYTFSHILCLFGYVQCIIDTLLGSTLYHITGGSDSSADSCEERKCGPSQKTAGSWC